jgi:toxin-antitoxin system PIN domain toxin
VTRLLDVNVLLAIAWPQHAHHARVNRWILSHRGRLSIATCPLTQLGFLRVSMNVKGYAADFASASSLLGHLVNRKEFNHSFWPDDQSVLSFCQSLPGSPGPNQLTDVYLVNLARTRQGILVTLDEGIPGPDVEVISS